MKKYFICLEYSSHLYYDLYYLQLNLFISLYLKFFQWSGLKSIIFVWCHDLYTVNIGSGLNEMKAPLYHPGTQHLVTITVFSVAHICAAAAIAKTETHKTRHSSLPSSDWHSDSSPKILLVETTKNAANLRLFAIDQTQSKWDCCMVRQRQEREWWWQEGHKV